LIKQARISSDVAERTRLYEKAQEIFKDEAPWVTMNHSIVFIGLRAEVRNYKMDPTGGQIFYGVDIDQ
jgi:dipeptide transport system substrate-binding protein